MFHFSFHRVGKGFCTVRCKKVLHVENNSDERVGIELEAGKLWSARGSRISCTGQRIDEDVIEDISEEYDDFRLKDSTGAKWKVLKMQL